MIVALVLSASVSGCGGGQSVTTQGSASLLVHDGSLLPRGGVDALIAGTLTVKNGCVGLASPDAPDRVVAAIWPSGTELVDDDPLSVRLPSGALVAEGQTVKGTGGYSRPDSADVTLDLPEECDLNADEIAVFNPDDNPSVVD